MARKSQGCWGSRRGSQGLGRQQEDPRAWGLAGAPLQRPGKRWCRCEPLNVWKVALRTCLLITRLSPVGASLQTQQLAVSLPGCALPQPGLPPQAPTTSVEPAWAQARLGSCRRV